ncbi:P-loop containing nucleoside triphosphate hydrolase protein [Pleurotus eryngii]|uniref:P-loop containing nucleoside triphosphate hydrolase protein n=1 Tax=Pleurotus eryngii TaxID=5323 RepID=A0A9P5ZIZ9_PLEER|nr:P-loop containing nucleoside triphosphate hydrolase protein [Pleurotus eryngii]
MTAVPPQEWTVESIRELAKRKFGKRACLFQTEVALALYAKKDVVACAPTGAGKTLSFWLPLLMAQEEGLKRITIVVTPLNPLGKQNAEELGKAGIRHYQVIVINPEVLLGSAEVKALWRNLQFMAWILNIIFDVGHCISQWGKFRKEYSQLGSLRYLIPAVIPFYVASATLPKSVLIDIANVLRLRPEQTEYIMRAHFFDVIRFARRTIAVESNGCASISDRMSSVLLMRLTSAPCSS